MVGSVTPGEPWGTAWEPTSVAARAGVVSAESRKPPTTRLVRKRQPLGVAAPAAEARRVSMLGVAGVGGPVGERRSAMATVAARNTLKSEATDIG